MRIWKALSFIQKTFTNDQKMPQSNLTHYQQHTINKQHTNSISAMESVSVEFRDPLECSLRGGTVSWLPPCLHIPPHLTEGMARIRHQTSIN